MRTLTTGALLMCTVHLTAGAACFNPFGCQPKNLDECIERAAAMPTEFGVRTARRQCEARFEQELQHRQRLEVAASAERADALAQAWIDLEWGRDTPISIYEKTMGQPSLVTGPYPCIKHPKLSAAPASGCYTYHWRDERAGRVHMYFKAEVQNAPGRPVRAKWPDSMRTGG